MLFAEGFVNWSVVPLEVCAVWPSVATSLVWPACLDWSCGWTDGQSSRRLHALA